MPIGDSIWSFEKKYLKFLCLSVMKVGESMRASFAGFADYVDDYDGKKWKFFAARSGFFRNKFSHVWKFTSIKVKLSFVFVLLLHKLESRS